MTLSKAISEFIREVRATKAKATAAAYESDLRRLASHAQHDTVLRFTPDLVRRYLEWESTNGAKLSTLHRKQAAIRRFARWCLDTRIVADDPCAGLATIRRQKTLPRPFSKDEIARLWTLELDPAEHLLRALLFFSGMRISAILNIRLGDLSHDPPTITTTGKGGRTQLIHMHPKLAESVLNHALARTDLKSASHLLAQRNGRPYRRWMAEQITQRWGGLAKVSKCSPHRFRHTFGTNLLEATQNLRLVQEAMGHADIASTTIYTEVTAERLREGIGKLPEGWGG